MSLSLAPPLPVKPRPAPSASLTRAALAERVEARAGDRPAALPGVPRVRPRRATAPPPPRRHGLPPPPLVRGHGRRLGAAAAAPAVARLHARRGPAPSAAPSQRQPQPRPALRLRALRPASPRRPHQSPPSEHRATRPSTNEDTGGGTTPARPTVSKTDKCSSPIPGAGSGVGGEKGGWDRPLCARSAYHRRQNKE